MQAFIRPMRAEDLDQALAILTDVAAEDLWLGAEVGFDADARRELWESDLGNGASTALVAVDRETSRIVGHGRVVIEPYGVAEVGMVLAAPARGHGIGGQLLDALVVAAGALGAHKMELQVWPHNEPAIRLYLSRGFVVEGRQRRHYPRRNGQLWDSVTMGRDLAGSGRSDWPGSDLADAPSLDRGTQPRRPGSAAERAR
jgi:RimJ/RimL family protein N-acetyltransferase